MPKAKELILWFKEVNNDDVGTVGGKNASLGEMYQQLTKKGVNIPNGFAITSFAYFAFLDQTHIRDAIKVQLTNLDKDKNSELEERGSKIRNIIMAAQFPPDLIKAVETAYHQLEKEYYPGVDVAVRSSATAEDLPDASFAGQQESFLNISGVQELLYACKRCMASLFTNRAISYRVDKGFSHFDVGISIGVQKMVRSDLASSGVMFSIDTETGFKDVALVTSSYGLGENVVQGNVNPDEFLVFKPTLNQGFKPILQKKLGSKEYRMIYNVKGTAPTKNIPTPPSERTKFSITEDEVLQLAKWACVIEDHYSQRNNRYSPMDMEWAKDGLTNKLFIVQARPETVHSRKDLSKIRKFSLKGKGKVLCTGSSVGSSIGTGTAHVLEDIRNIHTFKKGDVIITSMTDPDWEPVLKRASAIVTNRGGRTCHAAIISRELGIPCIVGCGNATQVIPNGIPVTVDSSGEVGKVLEGNIPFNIEEVDLGTVPTLKTKITMNLANPETAFESSFIPNQGVGLVRMEFIITNHIKCHPLALLDSNRVNQSDKEKMAQLIDGYASGRDYFINKLAQGISIISAAFYPKQVILRFSDFKTDEYANLLGGSGFEPTEANPMIGWRGASRYYDPKYADGFAMECEAVKKVREEFGLDNLQVMIPFIRTVDEAKKVISEMEKSGLKQGQNGLKIIGMCEIPANVILAEEFLDVLDGYSIGSNDLTQLTLGVDRNSEIVSHIFDERNEAVKRMISQVIQVAKKKRKYIGICGQAPSDYPEFASFLVREGIESISLNPDTVIKTIFALEQVEKEVYQK
jgi:pyruvate,water dikinase